LKLNNDVEIRVYAITADILIYLMDNIIYIGMKLRIGI
jgi:hypothetical protein